ncbi:hypothetical protein RMN57_05945 [Kitasatospora sp. CM 4170]|uniref:Uncharacterized protein n=1 Tax=Kitasatospora aburaviensis TaxID=67265 RepID=A0ABW1EYA0_9ACTN|nr:hypothetical protein [Kitasatospora sp. CM 4170]WNM44286.1 hypothetical protein RMN57_05945 [Kitasatospora sp. CM 4170]
MHPEDAASFEKTLALGKEIAESLPSNDVLGRWMAHHIGDLIVRAQAADESQVQSVRRETASTILDLWSHRASLNTQDPPMTSFGPVFRALERLSEKQAPWHFYGTFRSGHQPDASDMGMAPLLQHALELEDIVRGVVRDVVVLAAEEAASKEAKWLELSEHLDEDDQHRALQEVFRLMHEGDHETDLQAPHSGQIGDLAAKSAEVGASLRKAEARIARIRLALEEHPSPDS